MVLPVKLLYFAIERITEPIGAAICALAARSPTFQSGCRRLARTIHVHPAEQLGRRHRPLTDEQAARVGAGILGESVLWVSGLAVLAHQSALEDEEEQQQLQRLADYEAKLARLEHELEKLANQGSHAARVLGPVSGTACQPQIAQRRPPPGCQPAEAQR